MKPLEISDALSTAPEKWAKPIEFYVICREGA